MNYVTISDTDVGWERGAVLFRALMADEPAGVETRRGRRRQAF